MLLIYDGFSLAEIAGRWAALYLPVLVKISMLLATLLVAVRFMRHASASARHMMLTLGIVGMLVLPVAEVILPSCELVPAPDLRWAEHAAGGYREPPRASCGAGLFSERNGNVPNLSAAPRTVTSGAGWGARDNQATSAPAGLPTGSDKAATSLLPKVVRLPVAVWCFSIWLVGLLAQVGSLVWTFSRLGHMKRRARPLTCGGWPELLRSLSRKMGLASPPLLLSSPRILTPMTWGIHRPVVLLPEASRHWPTAQRREVLLHELAHIKRHDCLTQLAAQLARLIFWFNPLVTVAARRMRAERERACDDRVLAAGTRPSSYAAHLLHIATRLRGRDCSMPVAVGMARGGGIVDRLGAVLDTGQRRSGPGIRFTVMVATLILGAVLALAVLGGCSIYKGDSLATSWLSPTDKGMLTARIRGEIVFSYDETAIRSMGPDAYFALSTKGSPDGVRIEVEPDPGGSPVCTCRARGRSRPFDDTAAAWLAQRLPAALRELAVNVEPRIRRIYDSEGAGGVITEVGRLRSDRAKRKNLSAYFALDGLTPEETIQGLACAGANVYSPYELSRLLEDIAPLAAHAESVRQAYFAAVDKIWSPHEQVRLLSMILDRWMDNEQVLSAVAAALAKVESDYEVARLLDSIQSDADRSRVIRALGSVIFSGE